MITRILPIRYIIAKARQTERFDAIAVYATSTLGRISLGHFNTHQAAADAISWEKGEPYCDIDIDEL